jgi:hypothetical protein
VRILDEEPTDDGDEEQREEFKDDGDVLEPGHLADPDKVDNGRYPQAHHGNAEVQHARGVAETEQGVDVEHPRRDDGSVPRPGLNPVAPPHQVPGEVAELMA